MFRITILLILIFSSFLVMSQERMQVLNYQLKLSPIRLVDPINPGFELSLERSFKGSWSTQVSVAYIADLFKTATYFEQMNGYRFGLEQKYFVLNTRIVRPYAAVEAIFYHVTFKASEKFENNQLFLNEEGYEERRYRSYTDTFSVYKNTFTLNTKIGVQVLLNSLVLEAYVGLGLKYRAVEHGDRQYPEDKLVRYDTWIPSPKLMAVSEGRYFTLSVPLNVKIGYRF